MMRFCNEQKEDICLRMAELERKLAESEEERQKLEKTCNVLMRAFKEEEKMRYKALNKKYEKFLEDCSMRQRRNDIILRSLCRIEDRSKALSAKTERLKLLKDRCMSYLKINDINKNEVSHLWSKFPSSDDVTAKSARWKTPLSSSPKSKVQLVEPKGYLFSRQEHRNALFNELNSRSFGTEKYHDREIFQECEPDGKSDPEVVPKSFHSKVMSSPSRPITVEIKSEELARNASRRICETAVTENDEIKIEGAEMKTQIGGNSESTEKLKVAELPGSDWLDSERRTLPENEDVAPEDIVSGRSQSLDRLLRPDHAMASRPEAQDEERENLLKPLSPEKDSPSEKALPQGLDGVDYQNETYPESYYEQPVHRHSHTSIAADVILEEDETEPDMDEEADGGQGLTPWQENGVAELRPEIEHSERGHLDGEVVGAPDRVEAQQSDSEKSSVRSGGAVTNGGERSTSAGKSNLMRMLESDSESFQIEHGDEVSGQEDSDFDFSFGRN